MHQSRARRASTIRRTEESSAAATDTTPLENEMDSDPEDDLVDAEEEEAGELTPRRSPRLQANSARRSSPAEPVQIRQTGLHEFMNSAQDPNSRQKTTCQKRKMPASREGAWAYVTNVSNETSKEGGMLMVMCNFCEAKFKVGSQTRIVDHLLGRGGVKECNSETDDFFTAVQKLKAVEEAKEEKKQRKARLERASKNASASAQPAAQAAQTQLVMKRGLASEVNDAVARFFFGNNISARVIETTTFQKMVKAIRTAPLDWKPSNRKTLGGKDLRNLVVSLKEEEAPLRVAALKNCATVLSDGWDTVDRIHLVNQLVGTSEGIFFDGTVKLESTDHENADFVAGTHSSTSVVLTSVHTPSPNPKFVNVDRTGIFISLIGRTGALSVIHLCSDTCSTMKAAWRLVQQKYPWVTVSPCGTHVLNLELKDLGKLPPVMSVVEKVKVVLNLFWGRTRWPRTKLKEVITENHDGAKWGLYRAKATRFAGPSHMCRCLLV